MIILIRRLTMTEKKRPGQEPQAAGSRIKIKESRRNWILGVEKGHLWT